LIRIGLVNSPFWFFKIATNLFPDDTLSPKKGTHS
jgi:hypothetical protein